MAHHITGLPCSFCDALLTSKDNTLWRVSGVFCVCMCVCSAILHCIHNFMSRWKIEYLSFFRYRLIYLWQICFCIYFLFFVSVLKCIQIPVIWISADKLKNIRALYCCVKNPAPAMNWQLSELQMHICSDPLRFLVVVFQVFMLSTKVHLMSPNCVSTSAIKIITVKIGTTRMVAVSANNDW